MNLLQLAPALERITPAGDAPIRGDSTRCTRHSNRESACRRCVDGCPAYALGLSEHGISLDGAACIQCGWCLHACPTGAFDGPDETALLVKSVAALAPRAALDLTCGLHPAQAASPGVDAVVQTKGCLAALGAAAYAGLAALGVERVGLRLEACNVCSLGVLRAQIEDAAAEAAKLVRVEVIGTDVPPAKPARRPVVLTSQPRMSRRSLLRRVVGAHEPPGLLPGPPPEGKAPPTERRARLHFLAQLPPERRGAGSYFPTLAADTSCTACRVCATVCPTGALDFEGQSNRFALRFDPQACTGCMLCVELCAPGTLHLSGPVGFAGAQPVTLVEGSLKVCMRCRAPFSGTGTLCPVCAFRRKNPSGSRPRPFHPA